MAGPIEARADALPRALIVGALAVIAAAVLILSWPRLGVAFGHSHDGRNAAVWGSGSRALRDAPIASALGAKHADGTVYTNHPPLILIEVAGVETVAGEHPWSTRAASLLSLLAVVPLLYAVIRRAGVRQLAALLGVAVAVLTPMAVLYGPMVDTPMISLPLGLAVILAWQRERAGEPWPPLAVAALAGLACLSGWEAMLVVWLAAGWLLVEQRRRPGRGALALAAGAAAGTVLVAAWVVWATGSLGGLADQLRLRTSDEAGSTRQYAWDFQRYWMNVRFGWALWGALGCVAGLVCKPTRALCALVLATTVAYPVVLYDGAAHHDYWNYWWIATIGIGAAILLDRLAAALERTGLEASMRSIILAVPAVLVVAANLAPARDAVAELTETAKAGQLVSDATPPAGQTELATIGWTYGADSWIAYDSGLGWNHLNTIADLESLASGHPDYLVLVGNTCEPLPDDEPCWSLWPADEVQTRPWRWRMITAQEALAEVRAANGSRDASADGVH